MQYASMVSDITQKERDAEAMRGLLPNARLQLSYGAHVLVTMFTFFSLGYYGSKHYLHFDELWVSGAQCTWLPGGCCACHKAHTRCCCHVLSVRGAVERETHVLVATVTTCLRCLLEARLGILRL